MVRDQDLPSGGDPTAGEDSTVHGETFYSNRWLWLPDPREKLTAGEVSAVIGRLWLLAGIPLWIFMTYCSSRFVQASITAVVYVGIQIGGNRAIGRLLDQRIGDRSGLRVVGRSASCAIGLLVVSLPVLYLHPGHLPNCS